VLFLLAILGVCILYRNKNFVQRMGQQDAPNVAPDTHGVRGKTCP
jgi:hypothetical protein